jgi:molybdopterin converting factor small subunit
VVLRYWAGARAAAGVAEESFDDVASLADLLSAASARHADGTLPRVLAACSFLVDEDPAGTRDPATVSLPEGAVVEALPPFAGG